MASGSSSQIDIFVPQGANPLSQLRVHTARCCRVDFDRSVRSNVLTIDGDLVQSKVTLPKDDRGSNSGLQLACPLLCFQLLCPSSGQLSLDFTLTNMSGGRTKITAGTFVSRADVVDAKGTPHVKLPFAVPRNAWTQATMNIPGILGHLFKLPATRWIDSIQISGSARIRRIYATHDEASALDKPSGMLLFTVPAYGPPVWKGSAAAQQQQHQSKPSATNVAAAAAGVPVSTTPPPPASSAADSFSGGGAPGTPTTSSAGGSFTTLRFTRQAEGGATATVVKSATPPPPQHQQQQQLAKEAAGAGRPTSPMSRAVAAALEAPLEATVPLPGGGAAATDALRTNSAPAGSSSAAPPGGAAALPPQLRNPTYRRLIRPAPQPTGINGGVPPPAAVPPSTMIRAAMTDPVWNSVVLDAWSPADADLQNTNAAAAQAFAQALGIQFELQQQQPQRTPPSSASSSAAADSRLSPTKPAPSAATGLVSMTTTPSRGAAPQRAGGRDAKPGGGAAGPSEGPKPMLVSAATRNRRLREAQNSNNAAGGTNLANGKSGAKGANKAGKRGKSGEDADDQLLTVRARAPLQTSVSYSYRPKETKLVGYGVGDLDCIHTGSDVSEEDDSTSEYTDDDDATTETESSDDE